MKKTFFVILMFFASLAGADQIVNTYHPTLFGEFDRFRLVPRTALADGCDEGVLHVDDVLYQTKICSASGKWQSLGGVWKRKIDSSGNPVIYAEAENPANDIRVGINTELDPRHTLEVRGLWYDWSNIIGGGIWADISKVGTNKNYYGKLQTRMVDDGDGFESKDDIYYSQFSAVNESIGDFAVYKIDGDQILFSIEPLGIYPTIPTNRRFVGIGVTTPPADLGGDNPTLLHVRDNIQARELRAEKRPKITSPTTVDYKTNYAYMRGNINGPAEFGSMDEDVGGYFPLEIYARDVVLMQSNTPFNANVGVGTLTPEEKLHVKGVFQADHFVLEEPGEQYLEIRKNFSPNYFSINAFRLSLPTGFVPINIDGAKVVLQSNSNSGVGVGKTPAGGFALDVMGTLFSTDSFITSDVQLKERFDDIKNPLNKASMIKAYRFEWKDDRFVSGKRIGLIAQEVEHVFPEAVYTDENGTKSVSYGNLVAVLIEAIKQLQIENDNILKEIKEREDDFKRESYIKI